MHEVDFILQQDVLIAFEVKYYATAADHKKLLRLAGKREINKGLVIGQYAAPGWRDFLCGGLIF
ncbi:MAG: hypothetical protein IT313_04400 [Anaerolineales bacterium]|nr:hypothetical protein [Anaerolineales bacterium]